MSRLKNCLFDLLCSQYGEEQAREYTKALLDFFVLDHPSGTFTPVRFTRQMKWGISLPL